MANELTADLVSLSARGVYRPSWRFRDERRRMAHIYPLERIIRGLRIRGQLQSITLERSPASFPESGAIDPTLKKLAESNDERVIVVSNFGKVFYDQWTISDGSVNGTMLRIELGSPVAGAVVVGSVRVNGNWYP
jgi:hypothetical protein